MPDKSPSCTGPGPVCRLEIITKTPSDRFALVQDLIAISHGDDTITLSVKIEKSSAVAVEVDFYMRSHNHEAHDTLEHCQDKIARIVERHGASAKPV